MKNKKGLIGRRVVGFKFDPSKSINYNKIMDRFIGEVGEIVSYHDYLQPSFRVMFNDGIYWFYPAAEIEEHLIPQPIKKVDALTSLGVDRVSTDFAELVRPLIKYLNENHYPHTKIIIDCTSAELLYGELGFNTNEFVD